MKFVNAYTEVVGITVAAVAVMMVHEVAGGFTVEQLAILGRVGMVGAMFGTLHVVNKVREAWIAFRSSSHTLFHSARFAAHQDCVMGN